MVSINQGQERRKKEKTEQIEKQMIVDLNASTSIISLLKMGKHSKKIKRVEVVKLIFKSENPTICCLLKMHCKYKEKS